LGTTGDFSTNRLERSAAVGGAAWYLFVLGSSALVLDGYWEALPPPHDAPAYIGLWSFGILSLFVGWIFGSIAFAMRAGTIGLLGAVAAGASVILYGVLRSFWLVGSVVASTVIFDIFFPATILGFVLLVMYSIRIGVARAARVLGAAVIGVVIMSLLMAFGGPELWRGTIAPTSTIAAVAIGVGVCALAAGSIRPRGLPLGQ